MSRCLNPQTSPEKVFRGSKHLLTRYLEDFGCLGNGKKGKLASMLLKKDFNLISTSFNAHTDWCKNQSTNRNKHFDMKKQVCIVVYMYACLSKRTEAKRCGLSPISDLAWAGWPKPFESSLYPLWQGVLSLWDELCLVISHGVCPRQIP